MEEFALQLFRDGAVAIPITEYETAVARAAALRRLDLEISNFPEFKKEYTEDGTYALDTKPLSIDKVGMRMGIASSFHNDFVRQLRLVLHKHARLLFKALANLEQFTAAYPYCAQIKFEQLIDCMAVHASTSASAPGMQKEEWGRVLCPSALPKDVIFGGWFNLNLKAAQKFVCELGSHAGVEHGIETETETETAAARAVVTVPAGYMLVHFNTLRVKGTGLALSSSRSVTARLFTGWRMTHDSAPLMGTDILEEVLRAGAVVPLKTDQIPQMYETLNDEVEDFSIVAIQDDLLEEVKCEKSRKWKTCVPQIMPSLEDLAEPFKVYRDDEKSIYFPTAAW